MMNAEAELMGFAKHLITAYKEEIQRVPVVYAGLKTRIYLHLKVTHTSG